MMCEKNHLIVTALSTLDMAEVPPPPAVIEFTPALVTDPASEPATPMAVEVTLEKLPTAPTDGAEVGTASAWINDWLNEKLSPEVAFWVAAMVPGE